MGRNVKIKGLLKGIRERKYSRKKLHKVKNSNIIWSLEFGETRVKLSWRKFTYKTWFDELLMAF